MFTNHLHVLLAIARDPTIRIRDIAALLGVVEPRVNRILAELTAASLVSIVHEGRRSRYSINRDATLTSPVPGELTIGELLEHLQLPSNSGPLGFSGK
jgi:DNA-binding IscR family transcriptional regulator